MALRPDLFNNLADLSWKIMASIIK
jgi:hypothetical protein